MDYVDRFSLFGALALRQLDLLSVLSRVSDSASHRWPMDLKCTEFSLRRKQRLSRLILSVLLVS